MLQMAYHVHSLAFQTIMKHRQDYAEMMLHHLCAVFLLAMSYLYNYMPIGIVVLFLHDVGDINGYLVKMSVDTPFSALTYSIYAMLLVSWGYTRLWIFPTSVIAACFGEIHKLAVPVICAFLVVLQLLHVYWYYLFLKMGYSSLVLGRGPRDIQIEKTEDCVAKKLK
eukprot:197851_1